MRLVRHGPVGAERPGVLDRNGQVRDLSGVVADIGGEVLLPAGLQRLARLTIDELPMVSRGRLGAPVAGIGKIIGVGLNYRDHAAETNMPLPSEPTIFLKPTSALAGPSDDVLTPRGARTLDWEVELAVVIGQGGVYIGEEQAMDHVAGYCLAVDFSERDFQFRRGGQGFKGKSADTFGPLGPWLVTRDEIPDPQALTLKLTVNGQLRQQGTARDLVFGVPALIASISSFMSLQPGDVILTGTPAGVGMGLDPPVYLQPGDEVVASIEGLGEQTHKVASG